MYRRTMADTPGMHFKLDEKRDHTFWMHNTCIPLDMVFVDDGSFCAGSGSAGPVLQATIVSVTSDDDRRTSEGRMMARVSSITSRRRGSSSSGPA